MALFPLSDLLTGVKSLSVSLTGSFAAIKSAPVTNFQIVGSTPSPVKAGTQPVPNRYLLMILNISPNTVWWGNSSVTPATGFPIFQNESFFFGFDPKVPVDIYVVAEQQAEIRVAEFGL